MYAESIRFILAVLMIIFYLTIIISLIIEVF